MFGSYTRIIDAYDTMATLSKGTMVWLSIQVPAFGPRVEIPETCCRCLDELLCEHTGDKHTRMPVPPKSRNPAAVDKKSS